MYTVATISSSYAAAILGAPTPVASSIEPANTPAAAIAVSCNERLSLVGVKHKSSNNCEDKVLVHLKMLRLINTTSKS